MTVAFDIPLTAEDRAQLAGIIACSPEELDERLSNYAKAAAAEYVEMFLGRKVFTRGSDIREYRLFLLIREVFGRLPTEQQVSDLFRPLRRRAVGLFDRLCPSISMS